MKKGDTVGYVSKSGREANYKVKATYKKNGKNRVLLQSYGKEPVEFWVDREKTVAPFPIQSKPGAETRQCWECGCSFTWADAQNHGGNWSEDYCGC